MAMTQVRHKFHMFSLSHSLNQMTIHWLVFYHVASQNSCSAVSQYVIIATKTERISTTIEKCHSFNRNKDCDGASTFSDRYPGKKMSSSSQFLVISLLSLDVTKAWKCGNNSLSSRTIVQQEGGKKKKKRGPLQEEMDREFFSPSLTSSFPFLFITGQFRPYKRSIKKPHPSSVYQKKDIEHYITCVQDVAWLRGVFCLVLQLGNRPAVLISVQFHGNIILISNRSRSQIENLM